jgi:Cytochrome C'
MHVRGRTDPRMALAAPRAMKTPRLAAHLVLVAVLSQAGLADEPKKGTPAPAKVAKPRSTPKLATPGYLNELTRGLLRRRMEHHGNDMLMLVQGVLLLQRDVVSEMAKSIVGEPRLTRPIEGGMGDLNSALPERFFVLQDELHSRAAALVEAVKTEDDVALAARLGDLTRTCVSCHSAYLNPPDAGTP